MIAVVLSPLVVVILVTGWMAVWLECTLSWVFFPEETNLWKRLLSLSPILLVVPLIIFS